MKTKGRSHSRHTIRWKVLGTILFVAALLAVIVSLALKSGVPVLQTGGPIAASQRDLLVWTFLLMLIVVIPVFALTGFIAWRYRDTNAAPRDYRPNWDHHRGLELLWWGVPFLIIAVISYFIVESSHRLDPYRPLDSTQEPVRVQVVALQWKWLFIYPESGIATVNHLAIPTQTPIEFHITADAPMNSLWIPELGGQVYAMSGMTTKLHLQADNVGEYRGVSANISGEKYAAMNFTVQSYSGEDFNAWQKAARLEPLSLNDTTYALLREPATSDPLTYGRVDTALYDKIIMKYMGGEANNETRHDTPVGGMEQGASH